MEGTMEKTCIDVGIGGEKRMWRAIFGGAAEEQWQVLGGTIAP
jgi:hypothetical protein